MLLVNDLESHVQMLFFIRLCLNIQHNELCKNVTVHFICAAIPPPPFHTHTHAHTRRC